MTEAMKAKHSLLSAKRNINFIQRLKEIRKIAAVF